MGTPRTTTAISMGVHTPKSLGDKKISIFAIYFDNFSQPTKNRFGLRWRPFFCGAVFCDHMTHRSFHLFHHLHAKWVLGKRTKRGFKISRYYSRFWNNAQQLGEGLSYGFWQGMDDKKVLDTSEQDSPRLGYAPRVFGRSGVKVTINLPLIRYIPCKVYFSDILIVLYTND